MEYYQLELALGRLECIPVFSGIRNSQINGTPLRLLWTAFRAKDVIPSLRKLSSNERVKMP